MVAPVRNEAETKRQGGRENHDVVCSLRRGFSLGRVFKVRDTLRPREALAGRFPRRRRRVALEGDMTGKLMYLGEPVRRVPPLSRPDSPARGYRACEPHTRFPKARRYNDGRPLFIHSPVTGILSPGTADIRALIMVVVIGIHLRVYPCPRGGFETKESTFEQAGEQSGRQRARARLEGKKRGMRVKI